MHPPVRGRIVQPCQRERAHGSLSPRQTVPIRTADRRLRPRSRLNLTMRSGHTVHGCVWCRSASRISPRSEKESRWSYCPDDPAAWDWWGDFESDMEASRRARFSRTSGGYQAESRRGARMAPQPSQELSRATRSCVACGRLRSGVIPEHWPGTGPAFRLTRRRVRATARSATGAGSDRPPRCPLSREGSSACRG